MGKPSPSRARDRSPKAAGLLALALTVASLGACGSAPARSTPSAVDGVLDLSEWDPHSAPYVPLRGQWHLYWHRLIDAPDDLHGSPSVAPALHGPDLEFDLDADALVVDGREREGWGTYHLRLRLPPRHLDDDDDADPWMIAVQGQGRPYHLQVFDSEGRSLAPALRSGLVATSAEAWIASDRDLRSPLLPAKDGTVELLLQSSYFATGYRTRPGDIVLGRRSTLDHEHESQRQNRLIVIGVCIVMGLYHLGLFILRRSERAPLFFALLCLTFALRQFFRFDLFEDRFPDVDAFPLHATLEYTSFFAAIPLFIAFLRSLFPLDLPRAIARSIGAIAALACLLTVLPLGLAATVLDLYEPFTLIIGLVAATVMLRAIRHRRDPSVTMILGIGIACLLATTLNDILHNLRIIATRPLEHVGMFAFIFSQAMVLALLNMRARRQAEDLSLGLRRFVPGEFSQLLGKEDITDVDLGDAVLSEMTVLFCDIRGFTSLSERNDVSSTFSLLNTIYARLAPLIREHGGFIDKYIGDAIMAIFPGPPVDSVRAAVAIAQATRSISLPDSLTHTASSNAHLAVGIGIHRGAVMLGTIGERKRMEATVISDAVNIASRLEGLSKHFGAGILVSGDLYRALTASDPQIAGESRSLGQIRLAGKRRSLAVYEVFSGDPAPVRQLKARTQDAFASALTSFERGDFAAAAEAFSALSGGAHGEPSDKAAAVYAAASEHFIADPPSQPWSGVFAFREK